MADGIRNSGFFSLFSRFNKKKGDDHEVQEGLIEELGALSLDLDEEQFLERTKNWELSYSGSMLKKRIHEEGDIDEKYWMGRQGPDTEYENGKRPLIDNVIFVAEETMIAQTTQQNPEPVVLTDNGEAWPAQAPTPLNPQGTPAIPMSEIGDKIHMSLEYLARENNLKATLGKGVRHWSLRFLGAWETSWNGEDEEISVDAINPKDLILDKNAYIKNGTYYGEYIGRRLYDSAENLITRFPEKEEAIKREANGKLGSIIGYTRWRTDEIVVYTMKDNVLFKHKNEMWNYDKPVMEIGPTGEPIQSMQPGSNYWSRPRIPMRFLTVFDLGDEPADKTGLVQQSLVTQDNINKGLKQYDRNADNINGGIVVNGLMFNKEQAAQVAEARRQGRTVVTPGKPEDAIMFPEQSQLPSTLMERIQMDKQNILERFGVYGSTPANQSQEETVRGKIIEGQQDQSRATAVTKPLEIVAAGIYEDMLQGIFVFWDQPHWISVVGPDNAQTMMQFQASDIPPGRKIVVTVQDGSMIPQDELSIYNEAMAEWQAKVSDPLSYYEKTKDPNPLERAQKLMIFKTNPAQYMAEYLQLQAPSPVASVGGQPQGGGAPPASVPQPKNAPTAVQAQEKQLISSVPEPKI
jgi:hypothetical protein